jgi:hypothetical protein
MFIIEYKKAQQCCIRKLNPIFLFDLHQVMVTNKHQYVTKMTQIVTTRGLWGDFIKFFKIT